MSKWNPFTKTSDSDKVDDKTQSKTDQDALVERMNAAFAEHMKPLRDEFTTLKNDWESIKAAATKEEPPPNNEGELTPEQKNERDKRSLLALNIATNARLTEGECIQGISDQWKHLIPEIRTLFNRTPIERKAQPDYPEYCNNIVDMLIGKAARSAGLRYNGDNKTFFIEDAASKTGGEQSPLADPALSWQDPVSGKTESASETLRKLGIKPEDFVKSMNDGIV